MESVFEWLLKVEFVQVITSKYTSTYLMKNAKLRKYSNLTKQGTIDGTDEKRKPTYICI